MALGQYWSVLVLFNKYEIARTMFPFLCKSGPYFKVLMQLLWHKLPLLLQLSSDLTSLFSRLYRQLPGLGGLRRSGSFRLLSWRFSLLEKGDWRQSTNGSSKAAAPQI